MNPIASEAIIWVAVACGIIAGALIALPLGFAVAAVELAALWWYTMPSPPESPPPPAPARDQEDDDGNSSDF